MHSGATAKIDSLHFIALILWDSGLAAQSRGRGTEEACLLQIKMQIENEGKRQPQNTLLPSQRLAKNFMKVSSLIYCNGCLHSQKNNSGRHMCD